MTCNPAPTNMSDEQIQQWIEAVRNLYHMGKLRSWQIKRLEKSPAGPGPKPPNPPSPAFSLAGELFGNPALNFEFKLSQYPFSPGLSGSI